MAIQHSERGTEPATATPTGFRVLCAPAQTAHYRRPPARPFTAEERQSTTILFGNLTPKHDALIEAVFQGAGYKCTALPTPTRDNYFTGRAYCNNGLCNPNYFTAGNLIGYLRRLAREGLSEQEIVDRYVYFTIGGCGPCRFGMYESEYRQALHHAGFGGFRVLTFMANTAIQKGSEQPGLQYSVNFGLGMLNALNLGDILFDLSHRMRPFEAEPGATDAAVEDVLAGLAAFLRREQVYEPFSNRRSGAIFRTAGILKRIRHHLGGREWQEALARARERLARVQVDWLRVKPVVKATGEFYSAISEGDANYRLYRFLEESGAEVHVDPIGNLLLYWLYEARLNNRRRKGLRSGFWKKEALLAFSEWFWGWQYRRTAFRLGDLAGLPEDQQRIADFARPYYELLARGGEGHLIAGRAVEAAHERSCHLFLNIKPFGCMPATQADGVMAQVVSDHPSLLFLSIETSGEGEINVLNRVQMALADARRKAREEFDKALRKTGFRLEEIRSFVGRHPEMQSPFYRFRKPGRAAGTAAQFVLHAAERMRRSS